MATNDALTAYAAIFKLLRNRTLTDDDEFRGTISLNSEALNSLKTLQQSQLCNSSADLYKSGRRVTSVPIENIDSSHFDYDCLVFISSNWERGGLYVGRNWDSLLKSPARILNPIKQAFFTETSELTSEDNIYFQNYLKLSNVCKLIDKVALPSTGSNTRTIVFERDITISYTLKQSDLEHTFSTEALDRLLQEDIHHEAKTALVREALVKFLRDKGTNKRFGYLISHFNAFTSDLMLSYQSYVEQYTFDKVRKEYQEKQTEYIQKINETYSDIGAKVLAIPAGLWLAVFKLEEAPIASFGFMKNLIILVLCVLCMFYVVFHFSGQFSVLQSLKTEYSSLFDRLAAEHDDESEQIQTSKGCIDSHACWAWWKLALSNLATIVVFVMVLTLSWFSVTVS
ncbi:hypothetical protein [Pseudoalteromonas sp.]|jgi:hypothetical protein|uniref:hypothetical protein n=1 Tax=Pseudoalteromonas sp. TaxID=53249 RepID=UPI002632B5A6|nr:hypothetical protein [Pseudoalteromonas sp.]MCP3862183.1 hypothetical protein [Aestuariibacter sp.]MCP4585572.1 hypothetical protein [Pseudoalteromonas sp.]|tara:strand:- start:316 stop:1509 length:1194 start_codon:yes stop_codon:yes gene_type:complete